MRKLAFLAAALIIVTCGCTLSRTKDQKPVTDPPIDASIEAIKTGTERIHQELIKLAKYQQQSNFQAIARAKTYETPTEGPLSRRITLTWSGPIDKVVSKLAEAAGYTFPTPLGAPHFRDTLVQVDVKDVPIYNVLEDVGWQAGDRIFVILDQDRKTISLAYEGD